jgi:hypothetical protein
VSHEPAPTEAQLWIVLRTYLRQACDLFGEPAALLRDAFISRKLHAELCDWLRPLEALARRLLFLMARTFQRTPRPAPDLKTRAARTRPISAGAAFDLDHSENWRVSFNAHAEHRRLQRKPTAYTAPHCKAVEERVAATPLALRLEALIRVVLDPKLYAERFANKLARAKQPPYGMLTVPAHCTNPLYPPARDASLLICRAIGGEDPCADTS